MDTQIQVYALDAVKRSYRIARGTGSNQNT